jgi:predicted RND superfamily exporter protein
MEVNGDDLAVDDLVTNAENLNQQQINKIQNIVLNEHALVSHLVNPTGTMTGININILKPGKSLDEVPEVANYVADLVQQFRKDYPDHEFFLTGSVAFDQAFSKVSQDDTASLVPLMYLIIIVASGYYCRRVKTVNIE